ncbi:marine proteobacterial sortase target protein [Veronia pacifica]|uniref:Marine proteobacterial sortase target protein n=1 Tax=Veronia pacifica TaxID=1080227 RepID=A0A1C3EK72_9GAMM|nr:marine proteobacterial sortase target protein [Veronia pacifica]ODA33629.1 marine proteobacterial sortase target protein [Veronia pacifica]
MNGFFHPSFTQRRQIIRRFNQYWRCGLLIVASTILTASVSAAPDSDDVGLHYQLNGTRHAVPLLSTKVTMKTSGLINRASVVQTFTNPSNTWIHGRYVFPLPDTAAVDRLKMIIGDRIVEGEISPKVAARKQYEKAKTEGKKASLIEQHRPNIFSTEVANIGPGETVKIEIEYQETVSYRDGEFSLMFPTVVAPRYIPGLGNREPEPAIDDSLTSDVQNNEQSSPAVSFPAERSALSGLVTQMPELNRGWAKNNTRVPDAKEITPYYRNPTDSELPFEITVELDAGLPLSSILSPTFTIKTDKQGEGRYAITLGHPDISDRDFILNWRPRASAAPQAALFVQPDAQDGNSYGLLMTMPPQAINKAGSIVTSSMRKDVMFVLDVSGSMEGESIRQAKAALWYGLRKLSADDTFNLIIFNDKTSRYSDSPLLATEKNLRDVSTFIAGLEANGGTDMLPALHRALDQPPGEGQLGQVVFITDGSVGNESELFQEIQQMLGDWRLFTVGIGASPNRYFMERAAVAGKGTYSYIGNTDKVDKKMRILFDRLSTPSMRDISLATDKGKLDFWPKPIPDLYLQEPLLVAFRIPKGANEVLVNGKLADTPWHHSVPLGDIAQQAQATGIDVLWARNQIKSINLNPEISAEDKKTMITQLGLTHHIVTAHTSLVAVDKTPVRPVDASAVEKGIAIHRPAGMTMALPTGPRMAGTGKGSDMLIVLSGLLMMAGLILLRLRVRAFGECKVIQGNTDDVGGTTDFVDQVPVMGNGLSAAIEGRAI